MLLRTLARICYGLGAVSIVLSLRTQLHMASPVAKTRFFFFPKTPTDARLERLSTFFGLWAPTFAITGKILDDLGREQEMKSGVTPMSLNNQRDASKQATTTTSGSRS